MKGTFNHGINYVKQKELKFECYVDANFNSLGGKGMTGYVAIINGSPVTCTATKQKLVAQSTAEAEFIALCTAANETVFIRLLLQDAGIQLNEPTTLYVDNQAAIHMANTQRLTERSKHIDRRIYAVYDYIAKKQIVLKYVESKRNLADMLTKMLSPSDFATLRTRMGIKKFTNDEYGGVSNIIHRTSTEDAAEEESYEDAISCDKM